MPLKNYIRKNIYRWHRITSLAVALPVLLWTVSGFLHPIINSSKPDVKNQSLPTASIDTSKIRLSLQEALDLHGIDSLHNFRIVNLYGVPYYQVQHPDKDTLTYISCFNGQLLFNGDQQYAAYMAQRYLSESNGQQQQEDHHGDISSRPADTVRPVKTGMRRNVNITEVELVNTFTAEYKKSNVLLPVYRVQFERKDDIRLYIETSTGRLATAIDDKKAWFTHFFALTHSWSFLNGLGAGKNILLGMVSLLCFLTSLFGFYIYNLTKRKKQKASTSRTNRSWHRLLGNIFVLTTLLYAFSGAWHSFHKLAEKDAGVFRDRALFSADKLRVDIKGIVQKLDSFHQLTDLSIVKLNDQAYWQLALKTEKKTVRKYWNVADLKELKNGDDQYGRYLACQFSGRPGHSIAHSKNIAAFNHRYSMMNKRLPVTEVAFINSGHYYIETATGKLATVSASLDKAERFSFSNFHMHHYWEMWLGKKKGKSYKNLVLISSTLGLLILALTGLLLYSRKMLKKRRMPANS